MKIRQADLESVPSCRKTTPLIFQASLHKSPNAVSRNLLIRSANSNVDKVGFINNEAWLNALHAMLNGK